MSLSDSPRRILSPTLLVGNPFQRPALRAESRLNCIGFSSLNEILWKDRVPTFNEYTAVLIGLQILGWFGSMWLYGRQVTFVSIECVTIGNKSRTTVHHNPLGDAIFFAHIDQSKYKMGLQRNLWIILGSGNLPIVWNQSGLLAVVLKTCNELTADWPLVLEPSCGCKVSFGSESDSRGVHNL